MSLRFPFTRNAVTALDPGAPTGPGGSKYGPMDSQDSLT